MQTHPGGAEEPIKASLVIWRGLAVKVRFLIGTPLFGETRHQFAHLQFGLDDGIFPGAKPSKHAFGILRKNHHPRVRYGGPLSFRCYPDLAALVTEANYTVRACHVVVDAARICFSESIGIGQFTETFAKRSQHPKVRLDC